MIDIIERLRKDADAWAVASNTQFGPRMAELEREAVAEIERLRTNLNGRDDFIGRKGLWDEFVASLPRGNQRPPSSPSEDQKGDESRSQQKIDSIYSDREGNIRREGDGGPDDPKRAR